MAYLFVSFGRSGFFVAVSVLDFEYRISIDPSFAVLQQFPVAAVCTPATVSK